jgi:microcystin-dependent protein
MAEVTGLTAQRMLEIEANCIVRGAVVMDRLRLYTQGGAEIDAGSITGAMAPVGAISMFAGAALPNGWLFCDGTLYSSTDARYRPLWEVIGYRYGQSGTSFRVPNFQDRFPLGIGLNNVTLALAAGSQKITVANLPNHRHNVGRHIHRVPERNTRSSGAHTHNLNMNNGRATNTSTAGGGARYTSAGSAGRANSAGGHTHNWAAFDTEQSAGDIWTVNTDQAVTDDYRPRYLGVNFIIKL